MKRYISFFILLTFSYNLCLAQAKEKNTNQTLERLYDSTSTFFLNGDYNKSLEFNIKLVEKALQEKDTEYLAKGYRYFGYNYITTNDTLLAKDNLKKAESYLKTLNNPKAYSQIQMDWANYYSNFGEIDSSLYYHKKAIKNFKKFKDSSSIVIAYYNVMITYYSTDNYDSIGSYLIKLKNYKKHIDKEYESSFNNFWGDYLSSKNRFNEANDYYNKVTNDSTAKNHISEALSAYYGLSENLYAQGKYKEAFDTRTEYEKYQYLYEQKIDSANSNKTATNFQLNQYRKDIEDTKLRNEIQALKSINNQRWIKFLVIVLLLSTILIGFLWFLFYNKRNFANRLKEKNILYLKAKKEADALYASKTKFFSTISHELRTPLYGVIGLSSSFIDDPNLSDYKEDIKSLKFSADYLLALINDVLFINKMDANGLNDSIKEFEIQPLVKNIISSFEYMCLQNNNKIELDIDTKIPLSLKGHPTQLSRILFNLVGNACKFTQNGTIKIVLKAKEQKDNITRIYFSIKDNGIGIPLENQDKIFEEFSQVDSGHFTFQGTGLGLPIVKKLLHRNNEDIFLRSKPNEGAHFYFSLNFEIASNKENTSSSILDYSKINDKQILVVDDNRVNQIVTTKILKKLGANCLSAFNGIEAIKKVKTQKLNLVLMDVNMPIMDGIEASKKIREFNTDIPIIALTAMELEDMTEKIYASGMNAIVTKPYDIEVFKKIIEANIT